MPLRAVKRDQGWLLPPTFDELLPQDHLARFIAAFVEGLEHSTWADMGIGLGGDAMGARTLQSPCAAGHLALRFHDGYTVLPEAGGGLLISDIVPMAHRLAASGPQHHVAVLSSSPTRDARPAEAHHPNRSGNGVGRSGDAGDLPERV